MIHRKHQSLFVHNPKTGGGTVVKLLGGQGDNNQLNWHCPWQVHAETLSPEVVDKFTKFTFVRNPWARLLSAYRWHSGGGSRNRRDLEIQKSLPGDFETFVDRIEEFQNCAVSAYNAPYFQVPHFLPQSFMLGDCEFDFIGRFERFEDDCHLICHSLDIATTGIPHVHRLSKVNFRDFYTSKSKSKVASLFQHDIESFQYRF